MAGAWTTITILDSTGATKTMRVWSENSTTGPYSFGQMLTAGDGATALSGATGIKIDSTQLGALGQTTMSASVPTAPASDWVGTTALGKFGTGYYVFCGAGATTTLQSSAGATGDYLSGVLIIPLTTGAAAVSVVDNATSMQVFAGGGTTALTTLIPFFVPLGAVSRSGTWKVTCGTNVTALAVGKFS